MEANGVDRLEELDMDEINARVAPWKPVVQRVDPGVLLAVSRLGREPHGINDIGAAGWLCAQRHRVGFAHGVRRPRQDRWLEWYDDRLGRRLRLRPRLDLRPPDERRREGRQQADHQHDDREPGPAAIEDRAPVGRRPALRGLFGRRGDRLAPFGRKLGWSVGQVGRDLRVELRLAGHAGRSFGG